MIQWGKKLIENLFIANFYFIKTIYIFRYIRDKLNCSRPDMVELSNLRFWCDQYQTRALRLEKELKHVIERLKKHEPYNTDDSLFNENSLDNNYKTCVLDITKQGFILGNQK